MSKRKGTLAISVTAWQGLIPRDKLIFKFCFEVLALGESAIYLDPTTKRWATFTHWNWNPNHIAILGCFAGHVGDIPPGYEIPMNGEEINRVQLASDILTFCENQGMVPPDSSMETWQDVLDAQDAPRLAILMGDAIPPNWTSEESEELP